jgi:hypothetical protein
MSRARPASALTALRGSFRVEWNRGGLNVISFDEVWGGGR